MIITNNEELLRVKCEEVLPDEVGSLVETLEKELDNANRLGRGGIGLAAPQIGIAKKIAIVRIEKIKFDLVNCKINQGFDPAVFQEVYVTDNLVAPYSFTATGLVSVVCQHELDHLNSTLFMDHLVPKPVAAS